MKNIYTLIIVLFLIPVFAFAQGQVRVDPNKAFCEGGRCNYIPLEQLPGQQVGASGVDFASYVANVFRVLLVLGGMFAVATFVFGGITYMTAEVVGKKDWAKKQMQRAVYGILLLLGSYLLLTTLNPDLKTTIFNPAGIIPGAIQSAEQAKSGAPAVQSSQQAQQPLDFCQKQGLRMVFTAGGIGTECVL